ncbi:MAG TPA: hypothetical protein VFV38_22755 [Ktedonobacteraceae bacterium]|nr:hypothetical protein [Ktedonobacteraceae bacterium]
MGNAITHAYLIWAYQTAIEIVRELQQELLAEIRQEAVSILESGQVAFPNRSVWAYSRIPSTL